jgi:threonine dehydratase
MAEIGFPTVREAASRISEFIHRTPVLRSKQLDRVAGVECYLKCENFQRGGSFKIRGASNFLLSLSPEERRKGVVTFSSGNHGQAVAIAAEQLGMAATVVMPNDAPKAKVEATQSHGATIVLYDRQTEDREAIGRRIADETGAAVLPPYDHPWTIAGQGTAALEFLDEVPALDAMVVCLGGGGLLAGSLIAAKAMKPSIKVFGVEPELGNDWALSMQAGRRIEIETPTTIADGLRTTKPGEITFPLVREMADGIMLVTDDEIKATVRFLLTRLKILVEPSGAAAAAAVLHRKLPAGIRKVGVLITGGNVDLEALAEICAG